MSALQQITVLMPGRLHEHAVQRIDKTFRLVRAEKADRALIAPEVRREARGVAAVTTMEAACIDGDAPQHRILVLGGITPAGRQAALGVTLASPRHSGHSPNDLISASLASV